MKKILVWFLLAGLVHAESPNILFILTDDMSWVGTSVEMIDGNAETQSDFYQTPNIEKLAERGMRFSQAYSPGALFTSSRVAILTGKTPAELHIITPVGGRSQSYQMLVGPSHVKELPAGPGSVL